MRKGPCSRLRSPASDCCSSSSQAALLDPAPPSTPITLHLKTFQLLKSKRALPKTQSCTTSSSRELAFWALATCVFDFGS